MNTAEDFSQTYQALGVELRKSIVGHEDLIERLVVALLSDGHVLLEGVPGLAKTKLLTSFTACLGAHMSRVQFTPDLLPSDLVGTEIYRPQSGDFVIRQGPIFANLLLADEINRAPAKVQSALLQAMQERMVTIGEQTFLLPDPFLVLATQNPIEQEGTYPLPEAQLDRFLMKIKVGYPTFTEEVGIVRLVAGAPRESSALASVFSLQDLKSARTLVQSTYVDPKIDEYVVRVVQATREPKDPALKGMVDWGASPRASIALKLCARALAFVRGRKFCTPDDVKEIAADVLRHRVLLSFEAEAQGMTSDDVIATVLRSVSVP